MNQGRCVSCHVIEQTQALFTDNRFHNIGVGINDIQDEVPALAGEFLEAEATLPRSTSRCCPTSGRRSSGASR